MICHICLSEKVKGKVDRLELCDDCMNKISKYWKDEDVKRY